jgi:hypothetical protein
MKIHVSLIKILLIFNYKCIENVLDVKKTKNIFILKTSLTILARNVYTQIFKEFLIRIINTLKTLIYIRSFCFYR